MICPQCRRKTIGRQAYIAGAPFTLARELYSPCTGSTVVGVVKGKELPATSSALEYCSRFVPDPLMDT